MVARMSVHSKYLSVGPGPEVIKNFMLNSTEHEISTAHKTKMSSNEDVSYF